MALLIAAVANVYINRPSEPVAWAASIPVQIFRALPPDCQWAHESDGQTVLACMPRSEKTWVIRHLGDIEGGRYVPGKPNRLNINISGGNHVHRGYVVLSPDTGKGTILEDGHLHKLALFRANRYGGTEFRIAPTFKRGLILCDSNGNNCFDLYERLSK